MYRELRPRLPINTKGAESLNSAPFANVTSGRQLYNIDGASAGVWLVIW